jgi:hypothetical protein
MIQRIQSLLLSGVVILLATNLLLPIWTASTDTSHVIVDAFSIRFTQPEGLVPVKSTVYIAIVICLSIALSVFTISRYKNRPLQMILCNLLLLLVLGIIGSYFIAIPAAKALMPEVLEGNYGIGYFLPIFSCLLILGARHFIKKDEDLVRSVDRIR